MASFGTTRASDDEPSEARAFLDDLYARKREFLDRDPYGTIGAASAFNTKVVGVSFEGRQDVVAGVVPGAALDLRRDPSNAYDPNAIGVWYGALQLGFLKREIAARIAPNIDAGERYRADVTAITGGGTKAFGINIYVTRERAASRALTVGATAAGRDDVLRALIGDRPLREAQRAVLERVDA
ncbi:MAG TPA: HIRAN domain-containing protein, partial [Candidatus Acidoferrum sp.]|nr:HIRAN domain-containing protein [Candidatus Acidoferrum sp.]